MAPPSDRNARAMAVRALLATPISLHAPIPLEGPLYDARFRRDPETYGTPLSCLAQDEGIYRASASFVVADGLAGAMYSSVPVTKRIDTRNHAMNHVDLRPGVPASEATISPMSPMRPSLVREQLLTGVMELAWIAYGDIDEVHRMIRHVPGLGKLRGRGYGQVAEWQVHEIDPASDIDVGWFADGRILRRLPVSLVERRLGALPPGTETAMDRLEPPFWESRRDVRVAIPSLRSMTVTSRRLRELMAC